MDYEKKYYWNEEISSYGKEKRNQIKKLFNKNQYSTVLYVAKNK